MTKAELVKALEAAKAAGDKKATAALERRLRDIATAERKAAFMAGRSAA